MSFKKIIGIILVLLMMVGSAYAQLSPEQQRLYELYQAQKANKAGESGTGQIEQYATPPIFSNQDADFDNLPSGSQPPTNTVSSTGSNPATPEASLKIFGYNMFSGSAESFSPIMEATPPPDYKLGPGDNVLVNVWGRVDMQLDLTIDREGKIFIPKVGEIIAWGLTMDEFKERLNTAFSKSYSGYDFSVTLGKIRRIKIFVYGEIKKPGGYTTSSLATLFNVLYLSGGPTETGSMRGIKHIRNNKVLGEIDLYQFLLKGDNSQDAKLASGDVIFVPVVGSRVSISGQVKRPAIYELLGGERLTDLIDLAGGTTAEAFLEMVDVDRIGDDDNRIVLNVDLTTPDDHESDNNLSLRDGDRVHIPSMFGLQKNVVQLSGHVKHPGTFELIDSMRVSDLIDGGEQLRIDSYLERANLIRTWPDRTREIFTVNISDILRGDESGDYLLMDKDNLVVYSQDQIKRDMAVSIYGPVKIPGNYEYFQNMRLSDLIFMAGNPLKQAYTLRAEIARVNPGNPPDLIFANLNEVLNNKGGEPDIPLVEDDIVYIREIPGWRIGENVSIEGEVEFPGVYALIKENEKLLDLINRAGGLTPKAFAKGMVYMRASISNHIERNQLRSILSSTEETVLDSLNRPLPKLNAELDLSRVTRIIIDTEKLFSDPDSPDNIVLRNGDYIFVPERPSGIQVLGAVASSGTITYKKNQKPKYFIGEAGGYTSNANKGELRLMRANGRIYSGRQAFGQRVDMGDIIIVPYKMKKQREWLSPLASAMGIIVSVATTVFIIDKL